MERGRVRGKKRAQAGPRKTTRFFGGAHDRIIHKKFLQKWEADFEGGGKIMKKGGNGQYNHP